MKPILQHRPISFPAILWEVLSALMSKQNQEGKLKLFLLFQGGEKGETDKKNNNRAYNSRPNDKVAAPISAPIRVSASPTQAEGPSAEESLNTDRLCCHQLAPHKHQGHPVRAPSIKMCKSSQPSL